MDDSVSEYAQPCFSDRFDPTIRWLWNRPSRCHSAILVTLWLGYFSELIIAGIIAFVYFMVPCDSCKPPGRTPWIIVSFATMIGFDLLEIILGFIPSGVPDFTTEVVNQNDLIKRRVMDIFTALIKVISAMSTLVLGGLIIGVEILITKLFFADYGFLIGVLVVVLFLHTFKEFLIMYVQSQWLRYYSTIDGTYWDVIPIL